MSAAPPGSSRLYRRATAAALVVAPLLLLADNVLHPEELGTGAGNEARQLAEIAEHADRWQIAHILGFFAILLFVEVVLGLAYLVRRRSPTLGLVGGALGTAGLVGLAGVLALDGFTWGTLGELYDRPGLDRQTLEAALEEVQGSSWSLPLYLMPGAWVAGMIVLAAGLARSGAVPVWSAVLLAVAAVMAGTETLIVDNAYFIAGAAMMLAAGVALAVPIARMSDAEFASGGPATQDRPPGPQRL